MASENKALELINKIKYGLDGVAKSAGTMYNQMSKKGKTRFYREIGSDIDSLGKRLDEAVVSTKKLTSAMEADYKKTIAGLQKTINMYEKQSKAIEKTTSKKKKDNRIIPKSTLGQAQAFLKLQALWYPIKGFTFAALAIPGNVLKSTAEYGDLLAQVSSVAGLSTTSLKEFDKVIKDVGTSTKFSMLEAAKATKTLAQAGFRDEEITSALKPIALLATATSATIAESTNLTSTVMRAYGKHASDFGMITDSLANAVVNSRLNLQDLNVAFGYVASSAAQVGVTFQETIALLGTLANSGLKATTAATGLRMMLLKLAAPTKKAKKVLDTVGLSKDQLDASKVGIKNVIKELSKLSRTNIIDIFGARSANVVLSLINTGEESIALLQKSIEASGTAARMAEEQLLSLKQSWKVFQDTILQTGIGVGNTFSGDLAVNIRAMTSALKDFNDILPKSLKIVDLLRNSLLALGAFLSANTLIKGLLYIVDGLKDIRLAFLAAQAGQETFLVGLGVTTATLSPMLIPIAAVATAIGAVAYQLVNSSIKTQEFITSLTEGRVVLAKMASSTFKFRSELAALNNQNLPKELLSFSLSNLGVSATETLDKQLDDFIKTFGKYKEGREVFKELFFQTHKNLARAISSQSIDEVEKALTEQGEAIIKARDRVLQKLLDKKSHIKSVNIPSFTEDGSTSVISIPISNENDSKEVVQLKKAIEDNAKIPSDLALGLKNEEKSYTEFYSILDSLKSTKGKVSLSVLENYIQKKDELFKKFEPLIEKARSISVTNVPKKDERAYDGINRLSVDFSKFSAKIKTLGLDLESSDIESILTSGVAKYKKSLKAVNKNLTDLVKSRRLSGEKANEQFSEAFTQAKVDLYNDIVKKLKDKGAEGHFDPGEIAAIVGQELADALNVKPETKLLLDNAAKVSRLNMQRSILENLFHTGKKSREEYKKEGAALAKELLDAKREGFSLKYKGDEEGLALQTALFNSEEDKKAFDKDTQVLKQIYKDAQDSYKLLESTRDNAKDSGYADQVILLNSKLLQSFDDLYEQRRVLALRDSSVTSEHLNNMQKNYEKERAVLEKTLDKTSAKWTKFRESIASTLSDGIKGLFDSLIDGTKSVSESFSDMAESILKDLAKIAAYQLFMEGSNGLLKSFGLSGKSLGGYDASTMAGGENLGIAQLIAGLATSAFKGWMSTPSGGGGGDFSGSSAFDSSRYDLGSYSPQTPSWLTSGPITSSSFLNNLANNPNTYNSGAGLTMNITNTSANPLTAAMTSYDEKSRTVAIVVEDMTNNGLISRSMG